MYKVGPNRKPEICMLGTLWCTLILMHLYWLHQRYLELCCHTSSLLASYRPTPILIQTLPYSILYCFREQYPRTLWFHLTPIKMVSQIYWQSRNKDSRKSLCLSSVRAWDRLLCASIQHHYDPWKSLDVSYITFQIKETFSLLFLHW